MKVLSPVCLSPLLWGLLSVPAAAQATWSQTLTALAPLARSKHAATYDVGRGRLVMFGGDLLLADTWELAGATWVQSAPATSPPPRAGGWMAYDPGLARVVLFGGSVNGLQTGTLGDTWEWDGVNWTQRLPALAPSRRWMHAMTTDWIHNRIVLFGGIDFLGANANDTWAWNGANWTQLAATGPAPRSGFDMVQDVVRARIVLFGGSSQAVLLGDTWEFDGIAWQQLLPASAPVARFGHRMSCDIGRNQLILSGGTPGAAETWQWDGVTWTLRDVSIERFHHVMVHDWQVGRVTMFGGGSASSAPVDTTWTFGIAAPGTVTQFGSACAGPTGTPQLDQWGAAMPWIGYSYFLRVTPVPSFVLFLFGWSNTASGSITLPYSLAPHGAPGCSVLVSPDAVIGAVTWSWQNVAFVVNVPFAPSLVGVQFFNQAVLFDPGANPLGVTVSNGTRSTIGWR